MLYIQRKTQVLINPNDTVKRVRRYLVHPVRMMDRYLIKKTPSSGTLKRKASDSPANLTLVPAKRPQPLHPHESRLDAVDSRDQDRKYQGLEYDSWIAQVKSAIDQARTAARSKEGGIKVLGALLKVRSTSTCMYKSPHHLMFSSSYEIPHLHTEHPPSTPPLPIPLPLRR